MATIPTPEAIFYQAYQSLCGSDYGSVPKKKYTTGIADLKSQLEKTEEILDAIFRALKLDEIDDRAKESAMFNIMNAAGAYKEVGVLTFTFDASLRQIIWDLLGYLYVPGVARILANWNLEEPMDKDMPSGRFWYLPEIENGALKLPVAQVVEWYLDLLGMPLEKFAKERMEGLADSGDSTSESMIRSLYKWKNGTLPSIETLDDYFPNEMTIKYQGVFVVDESLDEKAKFAKALEFVKSKKKLSPEALQMEINISDLERLKLVLSGDPDISERRNFVEKLTNRYAAPTPSRVRQRLLVARMMQGGYTRLRKFLLPDVANDCADPEENKLVQLIQQFKLIYNLTTEAYTTQGHLGEEAENQWFEESLRETMLDPEIFLSILPSQRDSANLELSKILSGRFQKPINGDSLPDLLPCEPESSVIAHIEGLKIKYEEQFSEQTRFNNLVTNLEGGNVVKALAEEDRYDMLFAAVGHSGMQGPTYGAIFQRIFELDLRDYQYMQAWLFQTECFMENNAPKEMLDLAVIGAKTHPGYAIWKGPLLHLEGKHLINCNDIEGAIACFREVEEDCLKRNYGPLRGLVAQDLFASEIATQRFNVNNHKKYYRDIINFGMNGGAELDSVEDLAAYCSEYFWNELYRPYPGMPSLRLRAEKEMKEFLNPISEFLWKADTKGLEKWVKKNRQRLQKHLPDVRGDTVLSLLIKMWNGFRGDFGRAPLILQVQIPTAFRVTISTICTTAPKLLKMVDFKGQAPLMLVAEQGEAKVVKIMIEAGADPAAQDYRGRSALHAAIMNGHKDVIEVLLNHPECATNITIDGRTPAHSAITVGDIYTLERLLSIAPKLMNANSTSGTPMEYAKAAANDYQSFIKEFDQVPHRSGFRPATEDSLHKCLDLLSDRLAQTAVSQAP